MAASLISTVSAIKSVNKYAEGGIIKGNNYSGDNIMMPINGGSGGWAGLNAGEVVLNASQQSMLAQNLQSVQGNGMPVQPYVDGERIYLGVSRTLRRSGQGEIVTTSMLRKWGVI